MRALLLCLLLSLFTGCSFTWSFGKQPQSNWPSYRGQAPLYEHPQPMPRPEPAPLRTNPYFDR